MDVCSHHSFLNRHQSVISWINNFCVYKKEMFYLHKTVFVLIWPNKPSGGHGRDIPGGMCVCLILTPTIQVQQTLTMQYFDALNQIINEHVLCKNIHASTRHDTLGQLQLHVLASRSIIQTHPPFIVFRSQTTITIVIIKHIHLFGFRNDIQIFDWFQQN